MTLNATNIHDIIKLFGNFGTNREQWFEFNLVISRTGSINICQHPSRSPSWRFIGISYRFFLTRSFFDLFLETLLTTELEMEVPNNFFSSLKRILSYLYKSWKKVLSSGGILLNLLGIKRSRSDEISIGLVF